MTTTPPIKAPIALPEPDAIRAAIDAADEQARLLRRLLRLALRFGLHSYKQNTISGARVPPPDKNASRHQRVKGVANAR